MLILTRKVDQGIVIQGNIVVTVLRVERDRVKLGISAPQEITVLREELLQRNGGATGPDRARAQHSDSPPLPRFHFPNRAADTPSGGSSSDRSDGDQS
jgi:carbon storage regulator